MSKTLKAVYPEQCIGCELCVMESQRQLKKVGLDQALIRIFKKKKNKSEYIEHELDIDPRIKVLDIESIKNICPRKVFEIVQEEIGDELSS